jgi:hypothetical protein
MRSGHPDVRRELPTTLQAQATPREPVLAGSFLELVETVTGSTPFASTPPGSPPLLRITVKDEVEKPTPALAASGPLTCSECALRTCRGIELMHAQTSRIGRLCELGLYIEEAERLYERLINSVASLVQCLPVAASCPTSASADMPSSSPTAMTIEMPSRETRYRGGIVEV